MDLVAYAKHLENSYASVSLKLKRALPPDTPEKADSPPDNAEVEPYVSSIDRRHDYESDDEDEATVQLEYLGDGPVPPKFSGPLSNILLVKDTFQNLNIDEDDPDGCDLSTITTSFAENQLHPFRRAEFWLAPKWTLSYLKDGPRKLEFPPLGMSLAKSQGSWR